MIAEEMVGLGKKRSVIREIFEYAKRRKAEIGAENVFDFSLGGFKTDVIIYSLILDSVCL